MACFIAFEGGDGSGKSTQARGLLRRLRRRGIASLLTHEPGGTPLGESLRRILKSGRAMTAMSELLLFEAARAQLVDQVLRPSLEAGQVVIADRFSASTVAYQAYGRGLDEGLVRRLNLETTGGLEPSVTIFLDLPVEVALARKAQTRPDTFDQAPSYFHQRVREGYRDQAAADPQRWLVLDGVRPPRELGQEIWTKIQPLL